MANDAPRAADSAPKRAPLTRPTLGPDGGPARRESLPAQLLRHLSDSIQSGQLKPGDQLPSEQVLCSTYGVSRAVVREALSSLRSEGVVSSHQGKGVFVRERTKPSTFRVNPHELAIAHQVVKMLELRVAIEAEGAALAAIRRSPSSLAALRTAYDAMNEAIQHGEDAVAQDLAFHRALMAAAENAYFLEMFDHLGTHLIPRMRVDRFRDAPADRPSYLRRVQREHEAILTAIETGDAAAASAAIRLHLDRSRRSLEASLPPAPA